MQRPGFHLFAFHGGACPDDMAGALIGKFGIGVCIPVLSSQSHSSVPIVTDAISLAASLMVRKVNSTSSISSGELPRITSDIAVRKSTTIVR